MAALTGTGADADGILDANPEAPPTTSHRHPHHRLARHRHIGAGEGAQRRHAPPEPSREAGTPPRGTPPRSSSSRHQSCDGECAVSSGFLDYTWVRAERLRPAGWART